MSFNDYYGAKAGTTILQIFTEPDDGSEPIIHRRLVDQEAYDTWHLSHYFKEVLDYKRLLERPSIEINDIPRLDKNLLLYLLLLADRGMDSIVELGSTLYEMIDGFEVVEKYLNDTGSSLPRLSIKELDYVGVELSEPLRLTSRVLHPEYKIKLYDNIANYTGTGGLIYDRSVTNYVFETSKEMADFTKTGDCALLNTYFSLGETFQSSRLGKTLTYFSLDEFLAEMDQPFYHLFGLRAPGPFSGQDLSLGRRVLEGFFLYGKQETVDAFMELSKQDPGVAGYFSVKEISPKDPLSVVS